MANTILDSTVVDLGGYDSTYDTVTMGTGGIDTITLTGSSGISITSPMTTTYTSPYTFTTSGTAVGTGYITSNGTWTNNASAPSIQVTGDADFDGDVKLKGKSLTSWMETMEKRLAILVPDPKKLEKFEALQKAYNHYKMLEALCDVEDDTTK